VKNCSFFLSNYYDISIEQNILKIILKKDKKVTIIFEKYGRIYND